MFHLGWFLGDSYGIHPWRGTWSGRATEEWMHPGMYVDLATSLERAGFDYLFIEDTAMIDDTYGASMETPLRYGLFTPKNDPLVLMPLLAQATRHLGIITTISTIQYPPFLAARLLTSMDHVTGGRAGMNVVTSVTHRVAQNFGYDEHMEHDLRYVQAGEWMDVCTKLWESWEPNAYVGDRDTPLLVDHTKVHTIDHAGRFFKVRGPLNTLPGPQGRPVIGQAGNSGPGRNLAAQHADTMLAWGSSVEQMKTFRADMQQRLIDAGRKPDDCKIMFLATPTIADTDGQAREADDHRRHHELTKDEIEIALWGLSYGSGGTVDYAQFDLDAPLPDVIGNGEQSSMAQFKAMAAGKTLREAITGLSMGAGLDLVGSPDTVAVKMGEIMDEVGGDGFLLYPEMTRRSVTEICDGLVPALQRRGLTRTRYETGTFRDNLLAF